MAAKIDINVLGDIEDAILVESFEELERVQLASRGFRSIKTKTTMMAARPARLSITLATRHVHENPLRFPVFDSETGSSGFESCSALISVLPVLLVQNSSSGPNADVGVNWGFCPRASPDTQSLGSCGN
jgi:hypothetical protein